MTVSRVAEIERLHHSTVKDLDKLYTRRQVEQASKPTCVDRILNFSDKMIMRNLATILIHFIVTIARLMGPGGARSVVAESLLIKHQLLVLNRSRTRALALRPADRVVDGRTLCCLFNRIISGSAPPRHLSSDNDPLFMIHQWRTNLRILDVEDVKTVPYLPLSHPFVERLLGTIRREYLDRLFFWNAQDL